MLLFGLNIESFSAQHGGKLEDIEVAIKSKRYAEAIKALQPLANNGNHRAESLLGDLYSKGQGVAQDFNRARDLWEKASSAGDRDAMYSLAGAVGEGLGGPTDMKRAVALTEKSAALGSSKAQFVMGLLCLWGWGTIKQDWSRALGYFRSAEKSSNGDAECLLGFMYENGFGVPQDREYAKALLKSAKLHGCADAEVDIARTYRRGIEGIPKDYGKALFWFNKAVADGSPRAMSDLGWMYAEGKGVRVDYKRALDLFLKAKRNGYPGANYNLAEMYRTGLGFPKDMKRAEALYAEGAKAGDTASMEKLNAMAFQSLFKGAAKEDYIRAARRLQASAKNGDGNAECWLSLLYENGWGVSIDPQRAAVLMKSARAHGCADAEYHIGRNYLDGRGTRKDYRKAYEWLSKGAEDGSPHAMNYLGVLYAEGKGVKADSKKAAQLYLQGEKGGCPGAKFNLADCYRVGNGLPKDVRKAKTLYQDLANSGDERAVERLKSLRAD